MATTTLRNNDDSMIMGETRAKTGNWALARSGFSGRCFLSIQMVTLMGRPRAGKYGWHWYGLALTHGAPKQQTI